MKTLKLVSILVCVLFVVGCGSPQGFEKPPVHEINPIIWGCRYTATFNESGSRSEVTVQWYKRGSEPGRTQIMKTRNCPVEGEYTLAALDKEKVNSDHIAPNPNFPFDRTKRRDVMYVLVALRAENSNELWEGYLGIPIIENQEEIESYLNIISGSKVNLIFNRFNSR